MADTDNTVSAGIELTNADEVKDALRDIGETGAEAFAKIAEAASEGDFTGLATMLGGELAGSMAKVASEAVELVHSLAEAGDRLENLAAITGTSVGQLQGLQEVFASAGVSTQGFERSMTRLATTVAQSWAGIQESVRTAGTEEVNAQLGIQEAALNSQKAYEELSETMEKVANTAVHDQQNIVDARNNLQRAINTQARGLGQNTSQQDKALEQTEQANAVLKARQALYEANEKAADDEAQANLKIQEATLAVQKAKQAQAEAEEKAYEVSLKDIPQIAEEIKNVAAGTQQWGDVSNLAAVSAENLARAVTLAASAGGKAPDATAVMNELASLFSQTGDKAIEMGQKVELVTRLMGSGFHAGAASASELIDILSKGPDELQRFADEAEKSPFALKPEDTANLKDFSAAWAELAATITQVGSKIAAFAAPVLTKIFNEVREAILSVGKALSEFGDWLDKTFGKGASDKVAQFAAAFVVIAPAVLAVVVVLGGIVTALASVAAGAAAVAAGIAVGYGAVLLFAGAWPKVKDAMAAVVDWFKSSWVGEIVGGIEKAIDKLKEFLGLSKPGGQNTTTQGNQTTNSPGQSTSSTDNADKQSSAAADTSQAADKLSSSGDSLTSAGQILQQVGQAMLQSLANTAAGGANPGAKWDGGHIRGPGGPTDDGAGIYALSDGEYVVRTAAVQHYGVGLFEALNSLAVGGFATGGRVGGGVAIPSSGASHGGSSILNLTIDGNHFNGLRAPNDVAGKLKSYAVTRQSSAAGKYPSWMR